MNEQAQAAYPVLPLKNNLLFPRLLMPLVVGRTRSVAAVEAALVSEDKSIVVVPQRDPTVEDPDRTELMEYGTLAVIKRMDRSEGTVQVIVQGIERVRLGSTAPESRFLKIEAVPQPPLREEGTEVEALHREVLEIAGRIAELAEPQAQMALAQVIQQVTDPLHQVYLLATMISLDLEKEKELLRSSSLLDTLRLMHDYLTHELQVSELRQKIASQTQSEMTRQQREYILRQQLQAIQQELGERSPEESEAAELRTRLEQADLPEKVREEAERELGRLSRMSANAPDYQVTRTYLEVVLELPWRKSTEDVLDLKRARQVLDEDHYDLSDVKDRIVEHLAVMKLNPQAKAPILCLVGPPGVGKTSLGQSIARTLGREFERLSLGGLHDEAELRGHRRTYIGAMPGRIVQAIRRAGVNNPLLMLDEIDKLGRDFRGDPAAALMEILDPAQNNAFRDNFLDLPFDLSKVFFICTANTLDTIPRPLLDRMEVLRLSGYSDEEKSQIAQRYLVDRQLRETGLTPEQIEIPPETILQLIHRYTREAGVRELERMLGRLCRRAATRLIEGETEKIVVRPEDLSEVLGPERFFQERARQQLASGVAVGMAWTDSGGEVLYIEAVRLPEKSSLTLTGQLGNVMQESAKAAQSFLRAHAHDFGLDLDTLNNSGIHIHVPAGAVPKDGPSAGVTMATAMASLFSGHPARSDTAMTGEITLSGLVLPIGGVKEKVLAAHRAGLRRIVLPKANEKDLRDLPDHVRAQMEFILAERLEDVLSAAIPELAENLAPASIA